MSFSLIYWLRKTPQPVAVLADSQRIEVSRNGRGWKDLTATIKALEPSKVSCLDGQGNVLRTTVLESDEEKPAPSAEMSDLQLFAKLLAEGYEHGRKANQPIIDSAMEFVERQGVRLSKAEAEIERLRAHIQKLNLEIMRLSNAPAAPADDNSLLGTIVAGALQAQAQQAAGAPTLSAVPAPKGAKKP